MNTKTAAEITALSSTALRDYAKEIGVKRSANDTKATLLAKVLNRALEIEKAASVERQEIAAMKAKATIRTKVETAARAPKAKKVCNICNKRPVGNNVGISDMCQLCADEGGWENTHNDNGHEDIRARVAKGEELTEREAAELASGWMKDCWICFPEKNRAQRDPRQGTSKAGMVILAKGSYIHKSELVKAAIEKLGGDVHVNTSKSGVTRLTANIGDVVVQAQWIGNAWDYAASEGINGKKVRNVKELLRKLGVEAAKI
jgi:hypothetical protein